MKNCEKKFISQFLKDLLKYRLDGQTLIKCGFFKGWLPEYFFSKYASLVVRRKPYTKFQQLLLSKTAILEHP